MLPPRTHCGCAERCRTAQALRPKAACGRPAPCLCPGGDGWRRATCAPPAQPLRGPSCTVGTAPLTRSWRLRGEHLRGQSGYLSFSCSSRSAAWRRRRSFENTPRGARPWGSPGAAHSCTAARSCRPSGRETPGLLRGEENQWRKILSQMTWGRGVTRQFRPEGRPGSFPDLPHSAPPRGPLEVASLREVPAPLAPEPPSTGSARGRPPPGRWTAPFPASELLGTD